MATEDNIQNYVGFNDISKFLKATEIHASIDQAGFVITLGTSSFKYYDPHPNSIENPMDYFKLSLGNSTLVMRGFVVAANYSPPSMLKQTGALHVVKVQKGIEMIEPHYDVQTIISSDDQKEEKIFFDNESIKRRSYFMSDMFPKTFPEERFKKFNNNILKLKLACPDPVLQIERKYEQKRQELEEKLREDQLRETGEVLVAQAMSELRINDVYAMYQTALSSGVAQAQLTLRR